MTMIANYPTKKELKENIGKPLKYTETSLFGNEYTPNGGFAVCNRAHLTGVKGEFFASVIMENGLIKAVK